VVKEKPPVKSKAAPVKRKRVVKPKAVDVKSNVGKRKRLDEDVASKEVEDEDVVSDEDVDDVDERVSEEGNDAVEGNDVDEHVFDEEDKESEENKGSEEVDETNEAYKGKKKGVVSKSKKWKHVSDSDSPSEEEKVSKPKKISKKNKQVSQSSSSSKDEKPLKNKKKRAKQGKGVKKKTKKPPTPAQIKREKYLSEFPDTLPARLARFVVRAFSGSSYEFKLDKGIIRVTPEKVHEILGPLKDIYASDIAEKLVLAKRVDFMFEVNFLMLFANVMGIADTMKGIVNLTVLRRIREDTNVAAIDWCGFMHKCLQDSA
ncbi:hypothetical protein Tco_0888448, partial [Tanacetum coccineum]